VSTRPVPPAQLWWLAAGFALWCSALVALYAVHAVGCAFAWPSGPLRLRLALVLLMHLVVIGWIWGSLQRADPGPDFGRVGVFLHRVVVWTMVAAFVTTILTLGPPLLLTICM
jgi:hypothetical protein